MSELSKQSCEACNIDSLPLTHVEQEQLLSGLNDWRIIDKDGALQLSKIYRFDDFVKALDFTNLVGDLAESEGHHPALLTEWGRVSVRWWSHNIGGLHQNDFIMAAKTDQLD